MLAFGTSSTLAGQSDGGGGGNRTPVRERSNKASTGIGRKLTSVRTCLPAGRPEPIPFVFLRSMQRTTASASPVGCPPHPAYRASAGGRLALSGQSVVVIVGDYQFSACLTRPRGTSACYFAVTIPVETSAPPLGCVSPSYKTSALAGK